MTTKICAICGNKEISKSNFSKHLKSTRHLNLIGKGLSKNTLKVQGIAEKIIDDILLKVDMIDFKGILAELLRRKYKTTTIKSYFQQGFLKRFQKNFSESQNDEIKFILNLLDNEINNENLERDKKHIILSEINLNGLTPEHKKIIELYLMIPLRLNEFLKLRVIKTDKPNEHENIIDIPNKTLIMRNTKTNKFKKVLLKDNIINFVDNNFNDEEKIFKKSPSSFNRILDKLNINSFDIRRAFAVAEKDQVYASDILNHSFNTHVAVYQQK